MIRYVFKDDFIPPILKGATAEDAQTIGEEIEKLEGKQDEASLPELLVNVAKRKSHPLHKLFEWDDAKAGHQYRLQQARAAIRVRIVDDRAPSGTVRAYHRVSTDGGPRYVTVDTVRRSLDFQLQILADAERDLRNFQLRYADLESICDLVKAAEIEVNKRRERVKSSSAAPH